MDDLTLQLHDWLFEIPVLAMLCFSSPFCGQGEGLVWGRLLVRSGHHICWVHLGGGSECICVECECCLLSNEKISIAWDPSDTLLWLKGRPPQKGEPMFKAHISCIQVVPPFHLKERRQGQAQSSAQGTRTWFLPMTNGGECKKYCSETQKRTLSTSR